MLPINTSLIKKSKKHSTNIVLTILLKNSFITMKFDILKVAFAFTQAKCVDVRNNLDSDDIQPPASHFELFIHMTFYCRHNKTAL